MPPCTLATARFCTLFILAQLLPASATSCSSLTSCSDCRNSTWGCHWCSDAKCHLIGSPYGCTYGAYCYDNDQCQRQAPEYRGTLMPSFGVILGVLLVGGTALMCGAASISLMRDLAKATAPDEEEEDATGGYEVLAGGEGGGSEGDGAALPLVRASAVASASRMEQAKAAENGQPSAAAEHHRRRPRHGRRQAAARSFVARLNVCTQFVCGSCMLVTLALCTTTLLYAPHAPVVNVCNTEFDWKSVVNSITSVAVEVDYQLLLSIYNPNSADIQILGGSGALRHKHTEVGTLTIDPFVARGGYVTDFLSTVAISTAQWESLRLGVEYESGKLAFLVDASVQASVLWHGLETYAFTFKISDYYIRVSDVTLYDRSLCNCPEMMQARPGKKLLAP